QMSGQMTEIDAFNEIEKAVDRADSKHNAAVAFSELSPILQRIAGHPSKLQTWRKVSEESFHTVIMSQICRSYRELAQREADYYALPATMQKAEKWRIETNKAEYLPIPEDTKTISDVIEDANRKSAEHGMQMTAELTDKHKSRVDAFLQPVTKDDIKRYEKRFLR
ncbi:MAG: hypothetical protein J6W04_00725, partial [Bacteroidales bacterium]|nr:hypothetical protein [Bacteroidales bacterium]